MFAGAALGTVNYDARTAAGSGSYSAFGPMHAGGAAMSVEVLNIGEGVQSVPKSCFKFMNVGTLNYNAVSSA